MKFALAIVLLVTAACSSQRADSRTDMDPVADGAEADRHCKLAMKFADEGRCLAAGEQLAHCRGRLQRDARAAAELACPPSAMPVPSPPSPESPAPPPSPETPDPSSPPGPSPQPTPHPSHRPYGPRPPPYVIPSTLPPVPSVIPIPGLPEPPSPLDHRD